MLNDNDSVAIARFRADRELAEEVARILNAAHVEHAIEGSRIYEILVPAADHKRAAALLAHSAVAASLRFQ